MLDGGVRSDGEPLVCKRLGHCYCTARLAVANGGGVGGVVGGSELLLLEVLAVVDGLDQRPLRGVNG